ncbi:Permease of the drug/metabolite transporter (DMT) superfamily [Loktanella fryxellensis]|uniref:Permease of the drug/metabolite transporter (DMT) superfamily n=1 Tax=Loktanella fryxellensis TaxID=245187 RepID=A0A1H8ISM7_9RHOB|nr:DMT family transporter [Loktanella fryxellensis]SEN71564.1 Permease of the drug/metabolite transporter (DMT) superfamily [Loktanella fryxellensis]
MPPAPVTGTAAPRARDGVLWLVADMTLVTGMTVLVKLTGASLAAIQIVFLRAAVGLLLILPLVWTHRRDLWAMHDPWRNVLRVGCNAIALSANFMALTALPLAMANAIGYLRPIVTMLVATVLLSERTSRVRWVGSAGIVCGVAIAVGPDLQSTSGNVALGGLVAALAAVLFGSLAVVQTRALRRESPTVMMLFYTLGLTVLTAGPAIAVWQPVTPADWPALIAIGALGQAGQYCFLRAYRAQEATVLAPISYGSILFATAAGWIFFADRPSVHLIGGAVVILVCLLWIWRLDRPAIRL